MGTNELLKSALSLGPCERLALAEDILRSLDKPDPSIDQLWIDEAERRLTAHRRGEVRGIAATDVVGEL